MTQSQSSERKVRLVHVDTTQLNLKHKFALSSVPDVGDSGETMYEVKSLEKPSQDIKVILG